MEQDGFGNVNTDDDEKILIEGDQDEHDNLNDNKKEFGELQNEQKVVKWLSEVGSDGNDNTNDTTEENNGLSNVNIDEGMLVELPNDERMPTEVNQSIHDIVNDNKKELKELPNEQAVVVEVDNGEKDNDNGNQEEPKESTTV